MELFFTKTPAQVAAMCETHLSTGLSSGTVEARRARYGPNEFPQVGADTTKLTMLLAQCKSLLMVILLVAGIVSGLLGEYIDMTVILCTAVFNVLIGYLQESKADHALKQLRNMVSYRATVLRDGRLQRIDTKDLVRGDIMLLEAGDKIQADGRLVTVASCQVNEAALTGEAEPVQKETGIYPADTALGDRKNMVYRGTVMTAGNATVIITATGVQTQMGKIAALVEHTTEERTPLQVQLQSLSTSIGAIVVAIAVLLFGVGYLLRIDSIGVLFATSVAVAVAAIPEGLVISLTVILAIGMRFMLRKQALVRKLVAAETLGSVSVICTDKTGTITEGNMAVARIITASHDLEMSELLAASPKKQEAYGDVLSVLRAAALANDGSIDTQGSTKKTDWRGIGDTTDTALLFAAHDVGITQQVLVHLFPRLAEIPFSSERKYMATLVQTDTTPMLYVKGAPEVLFAQMTHVRMYGKDRSLTQGRKEQLLAQHAALTALGLRVIAVASRTMPAGQKTIAETHIERLTMLGLVGLADPVRKGVKDTIALAQRAGIRTIMITGDHASTASAIAARVGLPHDAQAICTGALLDSLSDAALEAQLGHMSLFARVEPEHKIRIIRALQARGEVVAMTGDGVNDAPALKGADIGVALGSGTDVAKETSDVVLLDDGFPTIVSAVKEGRTMYQNIKKIILYLLSGSFAEVVMIMGSMLAGLPIAALPTQILWINLINDTFPNMALAFDKGAPDTMRHPPRKKSDRLIDRPMLITIIAKSILSNVLLFGIFLFMWRTTQDIALTRTIVFVGFGVDALWYIFSIRSLDRHVWQTNPFDNRYLVMAVCLGWLLLFAAVYAPPLQYVLHTVPLAPWHWGMMLIFGLANVLIIEGVKRYFFVSRRRQAGYPEAAV